MYAAELAAKTVEPSADEERLAEDYVTILASVSAMDQAFRDGDWSRARDEADQLMSAAEEMWSALSAWEDGEHPGAPVVVADAAKVRQLIAVYARPHAVGRALYPASLIEDFQLRTTVENEDLAPC
ncbi:hypothetical protein [Streptomyces sp. NPDC053048]|uniref:hypothetical protein n=1 Tax=Streptomyces sp. NPDC053048 TaxID=3365694 RepID=UPI0037D20F4F